MSITMNLHGITKISAEAYVLQCKSYRNFDATVLTITLTDDSGNTFGFTAFVEDNMNETAFRIADGINKAAQPEVTALEPVYGESNEAAE